VVSTSQRFWSTDNLLHEISKEFINCWLVRNIQIHEKLPKNPHFI
jgi:hypothetical protein